MAVSNPGYGPEPRLLRCLIVFGLSAGAIGGIAFQLGLSVTSGYFSPAAIVFGLVFLVFEIPMGMIVGVVSAVLGWLTSRFFAQNQSPWRRAVTVGLGAFVATGLLTAAISLGFRSWIPFWVVFLSFGAIGALAFGITTARYLAKFS
ncbi:hypothetical protein SAMN06295879_2060 [Agreia bicolorata]|uniref:Uncharacterized protein n=1 Tax=Agreia bicolorata TaxID=110935 RepID=A0A1T4Y1N5_9MICO|nr:hypothetical protein [Agreia bicolorata]SKA95680.1 hypothetical protein SAMN06295879_2060 [Agreia bicolorata]